MSSSSRSRSRTRTGILWGRDVLLETWDCLHLKPSADIDQLWPSHLLILADQTSEACFDAWAGADMDQLKQRVARLLGKNRWQILGHDRSHQIDQKSTPWQNLYFSPPLQEHFVCQRRFGIFRFCILSLFSQLCFLRSIHWAGGWCFIPPIIISPNAPRSPLHPASTYILMYWM